MTPVGSRVRRQLQARRSALGMTQGVLAQQMGTTQSAVSDLENGRFDIQISTLERWASCLGFRVRVDLDDLWADRGPMNSGSKPEADHG